jgi:hypothetical protein
MTPELSQRLGSGVERWHVDGVAQRWGFVDPASLGFYETGMSMTDEAAQHLPFPPKETLLAYVRDALALADSTVQSLTDAELESAEQLQPMTEELWEPGTVANAIMGYVTHDSRHLGMMEALLGLQGARGSATS